MKHSRLFNDGVEVVTDLVSDAVPEIAEVERRKRQVQENHKRETGKLKTKRNGSPGQKNRRELQGKVEGSVA